MQEVYTDLEKKESSLRQLVIDEDLQLCNGDKPTVREGGYFILKFKAISPQAIDYFNRLMKEKE